jgi:hypothetical protein
MDAEERFRLWASGLISCEEWSIIIIPDQENGDRAEFRVTLPDGSVWAQAAFLNDEDGHIHIDTGMNWNDFEARQGSADPQGLALMSGPVALTLNRTPTAPKERGGLPSGERSFPDCFSHKYRVEAGMHPCDACRSCSQCGAFYCEWDCSTIERVRLESPII